MSAPSDEERRIIVETLARAEVRSREALRAITGVLAGCVGAHTLDGDDHFDSLYSAMLLGGLSKVVDASIADTHANIRQRLGEEPARAYLATVQIARDSSMLAPVTFGPEGVQVGVSRTRPEPKIAKPAPPPSMN